VYKKTSEAWNFNGGSEVRFRSRFLSELRHLPQNSLMHCHFPATSKRNLLLSKAPSTGILRQSSVFHHTLSYFASSFSRLLVEVCLGMTRSSPCKAHRHAGVAFPSVSHWPSILHPDLSQRSICLTKHLATHLSSTPFESHRDCITTKTLNHHINHVFPMFKSLPSSSQPSQNFFILLGLFLFLKPSRQVRNQLS
jgi:hypothetical protein